MAWFNFGRFLVTLMSLGFDPCGVGVISIVIFPPVRCAHRGLFGFDPAGQDFKSVILI